MDLAEDARLGIELDRAGSHLLAAVGAFEAGHVEDAAANDCLLRGIHGA